MGVPPEKLLGILYKKEAAKRAQAEVEAAMKVEVPAGGGDEGRDESKSEPNSPTPDMGAAAKKDDDKAGQPGKNNLGIAGATKLQRDLSVKTMHSNATADTMEGSLIAPPFKFGT